MATILKLKPRLDDKQANKLAGTLLTDNDYNTLVTYDADVYCEETGKPIAKLKKNENNGKFGHHTKKRDGTISNTSRALTSVNSGIIGYFDRNPRFPYCRQTAFNEKQFSKFVKAYPIIKFVDTKYQELMPEYYKKQRKVADETSKDFVIRDTAFTTVTVNSNWQTAVHTDKGDFEEGFGNLVALRKGRYTGGYFVIPKWGVAFDLQNCDLLLCDVHQWHGNTPINKVDDDAKRISLVMYYRKNMVSCGTAEEEANIVKRRLQGEKLN